MRLLDPATQCHDVSDRGEAGVWCIEVPLQPRSRGCDGIHADAEWAHVLALLMRGQKVVHGSESGAARHQLIYGSLPLR